ncbi:MAG: hypothetical protein BGO51_04600 [Rhodospirillales bacterium 69-11]|nr:FUSC family protein [Rhodospirillales bacterium]OJW23122.1 MAG: hypothetical protein BGO51_04600 [Rhodospirillales bacterium 69-11]
MADRIPKDLRRLPISLNRQGISVLEGVRAALAVAAIIALDEWVGWHLLGEAALAAMLTCICDPGGPIRRRLPVLLGFTALGALLTAGLGLIRGLGMPVALPVGLAALFCASFSRVYGQSPQLLGALLSTVIVLSLDRGLTDPGQAALLGSAFIGGGLWATVLTLALWPLHPFLPARRAVAEAYRRLALLSGDLRGLLGSRENDPAAWERHARAHRGAVRQALETARAQVVDTLRARGPAGARAAQSLIRLETADQVFGVLIALGELLEHASPQDRAAAARLLRRLRPVLLVLGEIIVTDDPAAHPRIRRAIDGLAREGEQLSPGDPMRVLVQRLVERLRIAQTLAVPANLLPGADAAGRPPPLAQRLWQPLRTNLTWRSPILRHSLRAVTAAAPALAFTMWWFTPYDHWLTITIIATVQPFFALTYARAVERVLGTAAGGAIAALIAAVCTTPLSIAAAMFPLSVVAFTVRSVSLGLFMFGLTPLVVLLVETAEPGASEWLITGARAALTTLGGVIAVAASFLLWPTREPAHVASGAREAIVAHARYAEAVFAHLLRPGDGAALDRARREAGIATNTFEATINRALLEPRTGAGGQLEAALVIDAALRRCAGRLSVLQFEAAGARDTVPDAALAGWGAWIVAGLEHVGSGDPALPPRPELPGTDAILRLARQVDLMAGVVARLHAAAA